MHMQVPRVFVLMHHPNPFGSIPDFSILLWPTSDDFTLANARLFYSGQRQTILLVKGGALGQERVKTNQYLTKRLRK